ncbi:MAG: hypothetical protein HKP61_21805 [Dactylosporangium sp.]|nr:carboxypeptidase regulatory-like domain-containing protein [Dactylosporangium sp.]NNJ63516.1 hypothetical protein [Dactylosporangium sp.]
MGALVAGALVGVASPAYAADVTVNITAGDGMSLDPGGSSSLSAEIENTGSGLATAKLTFSSGDVTAKCSTSPCAVAAGQTKTLRWTVTESANPTTVAAGQSKSVTATVEADDGSDTAKITIRGVAAPTATQTQTPTVAAISGTVTDSTTGDVIKDATVMVLDGNRKRHQTGSDSSGRFRFTGSSSEPIVPGSLTLGASKDSFQTVTTTKEARAGQTLSGVQLKLKPTAEPEASAVESIPIEELPENDVDDGAGAADPGTKASSGLSTVSWILIILGTMLVLFPIVVIVMLWRKREKDDDLLDEEGEDGPDPRPRGGPQTPGAQGMYHGDPMGRGGADATMITPNNMSDATAIVHTPMAPPQDPYQAQEPGYDHQYGDSFGSGYGLHDHSDYSAATTVQPGGYSPGGYEQQPGRGPAGYDEYGGPRGQEPTRPGGYASEPPPTTRGGYDAGPPPGHGGGYDAPPSGRGGYGDGYDAPPTTRGGYDAGPPPGHGGYDPGPPRGGYDAGPPPGHGGHGGYDAPPTGRGGYDAGYDAPPTTRGGYGDGYDAPPTGRGGYDAGPPPGHGGYDAPPTTRGGYDAGYDAPPTGRGGYDPGPPRGGYDAGPPPGHGGYGEDPYYDGPSGRQPPPPSNRGGKRSVEWLDD